MSLATCYWRITPTNVNRLKKEPKLSLLLNYRYLCYFQGVILQSTICFSILEMIISQAKEHLKCLHSDIFISHIYPRWWLSGAWGTWWPLSKDPGFYVAALCWIPNNHRPGFPTFSVSFLFSNINEMFTLSGISWRTRRSRAARCHGSARVQRS